MTRVSRADRVVALVLVLVLVGLLAVVLVRRAHAAANTSTSTPSATARDTNAGRTGPHAGASSTTAVPAPSTTEAPPASTTTAPTTTTTPTVVAGAVPPLPATLPVPGPVTAVGDSIMLDIQADLQADIPGVQVDGLVSRQFDAGIGVVQADRAAGTLGNVLVVELGTNGSVTSSEVDELMQAATGVQRVVFVNVNVDRPWAAPDNQVLAAAVARYPGVAVLADWNALSTGQTQWFTPDGVHLEPGGAQAMAALITGLA